MFVVTEGNKSLPGVSISTPLHELDKGQSDHGGKMSFNDGNDYAMLQF